VSAAAERPAKRRAAKRIVLLTGHYYESKRRAGFHFLADAFNRAGHDVLFVTTSLSWLSRLGGDPRFAYPILRERGRVKRVRDGLQSYVWFTQWHPAHLRSRILNRVVTPLYRRYGDLPLGPVEPLLKQADVFVVECGPPLLLVDRLRQLHHSASFIYRVSDDQRLLHHHPVMLEAESRTAPQFDLVSTPSEFLHRRFRHLPQAALHNHGVEKEGFDCPRPSPYSDAAPANCVFVGNAHLDVDFLERASSAFPEWRFHIIGHFPHLPLRANIVAHGELPFDQTVAYLQHATIGLTTLSYRFGAESFTDSLKTLQYTYCRLPIVAPEFLRSSRNNVFYYTPGDGDSIRRALTTAGEFDRSKVARHAVASWDDVAESLLSAVSQ
jgi:2-beta-glucuronyltransferase